MKHFFATRAPFREEVLRVNTIAEYLDAVWHYSAMPETHEVFGNSDWHPDDDRPSAHIGFVGAAGEFLTETLLREYGSERGITDVWSTNSPDSPEEDRGIDHFGTNTWNKKMKDGRELVPGTGVFIQTKFVRSPRKEFRTNDGSRLMNFYAHAFGRAISERIPFRTRYVLVTTGKGIHWAMDRNTFAMTEIINREWMSERIDGNDVFWNKMREAAGVAQKTIDIPKDY